MKRLYIYLTLALMFCPVFLKAQSATDTVPYCCDFESVAERAYWRFANTSGGNRWCTGVGNQTGQGLYSMYITSDGVSNTYSNVQSWSYAFRRIYIPAGVYEVDYDWVANGYSSTTYAYLRAFLIPDNNVTFTGGQMYAGLSPTTLPTGSISLDRNTALLLQSNWTHFNDPLVQVPQTGNYLLVFFWYNYTSTSQSYQPPAAIDNICITPVTCPKPMQLRKRDLGNGCLEINWTDYGSPQPVGWIIEYGQRGFTHGNGSKIATNHKPDTICGLQSDVTYEFLVRAICANGDTSNYSDPVNFRYCTGMRCIDFTNLRGPGVTCTYGKYQYYQQYTPPNYGGPYYNIGVVDQGPGSYGTGSNTPGSLHTVNTDPNARDPLFPQLLKIPPDECESVRLGSFYGGYICQSISYSYVVDTANADILLFKYAAVFNDVGHTPSTIQPRFVFEILDQQNTLINPTCGAADYDVTLVTNGSIPGTWYSRTGAWSFIDTIVDSNSGAIRTQTLSGSTYGTGLKARDWTPLGLNISAYHGQTIRVRITSFNCGQSGPNHCCYVYYTLGCSKARIIANTCGNNAQHATLTAPSGFRYRWYNPSLPNWHSDQQTVQVDIDSSVYYCEVSFVDDTSCKFTMSTMAAPRFPHARFTASLDTTACNYAVNVRNLSYTSISATDTHSIGDCESFYWYWGDGSTTSSRNPGSHTYRQPGTYTIMLVVGLAGDECTDTVYYTVTFNAPQAPTISGDSVVCVNTRAHIQVNGLTATRFQWSTGHNTREIDVYPPDSGTYTVHVWDQLGCETVLSFHVDVDTVPLPIFEPSIYESCVPYTMSIVDINPESQGNTYSWSWGDGSTTPNNNTPTHTYSSEGDYRFTCFIKSAEGCLDTVYNTAHVYGFPHSSFSWTPPIITVTNPEVQFINLTTPNAPTNVYDWEVFYHTSNPVRYSNTFEPSHRWTGSTTEFSGSNLVRLITTNQVQTASGGFVSCVDTVENTVLVINDLLQFPNTVTPNGDGINDIFEIKNLIDGGGFTDNELYIYNHWGRKVYHKTGISTREDFWDPAANNDPDGTYYYRFSAKGYMGNILRNGTITVVR